MSFKNSCSRNPLSRRRPLGLERLEDRCCPSLTLTQAGVDRGIGISIVAVDFPVNGGVGPLGIAFPDSGGILVSDQNGNVRVFASDSDGQSADWFPPLNYGYRNAHGIAKLNGTIYMTQATLGDLVQLNDDGTINQVILTGLPNAIGLAANPYTGHLFVSFNGSIADVDPVAQTATTFVTGSFDGLTLSADGSVLYAARGDMHIIGFDVVNDSHPVIFDSGPIAGNPDGVVEGTGALAGNIYVNTNGGTVVEVNLDRGQQTVIANHGTRGDFVAVDPYDGSGLFTQSDRIIRLRFPPAQNPNLIGNGDFEAGDVGFTSDYQSAAMDGGPGFYSVVTDPRNFNIDATSYGDHTSGSGFMLAVDGAMMPDQVVWSETVSVTPNTRYTFAIWVSSWYPLSPAELDFRFNDQSIGTFTAPQHAGVWREFETAWTSGSDPSVMIRIIDNNTQFSGNDFALDDISLLAANGPAYPEALSWKGMAVARAESPIASAERDSRLVGHEAAQSAAFGPPSGPELAAGLIIAPGAPLSDAPLSLVNLQRISRSEIEIEDPWNAALNTWPGAVLGGWDWSNGKHRGYRGSTEIWPCLPVHGRS
jgi:hypothetical protein